jgi:hypothetical protein
MVMDNLWEPNSDGYYMAGYADDRKPNQWEIPSNSIRGLTDIYVYSPTVV